MPEVREVYARREVDILNRDVWAARRRQWPGLLRAGAPRRNAALQELADTQQDRELGLALQALCVICDPAREILARELELMRILKPRSWEAIDSQSAAQIRDTIDSDPSWIALRESDEAYEEIASGIKSLTRTYSERGLADLEDKFMSAAWKLYQSGKPVILVLIDDWGTNPNRPGGGRIKVAEVDIILGMPVKGSPLDIRLDEVFADLKEEYPENRDRKWMPERLLMKWIAGLGWEELSATYGTSFEGGKMMLSVNLPKTLRHVSRAWEMAGMAANGEEATEYLNTVVAIHELGHSCHNLRPMWIEFGPDLIYARKCLQMIRKKRPGWTGMTLKKMILTTLGESAGQAHEKKTGDGNNDGYPYSGERMVNIMFKSGLVTYDGGILKVDTRKVGEYLAQLTEVEEWLVSGKRTKVEALGDLSSQAKKFLGDFKSSQ